MTFYIGVEKYIDILVEGDFIMIEKLLYLDGKQKIDGL